MEAQPLPMRDIKTIIPGQTHVPSSFLSTPHFDNTQTQSNILNHVALLIHDISTSLAFYHDVLGMQLVFGVNAGPFIAYYLGYPTSQDSSPADVAKTSGTRSGLLELIVSTGDDAIPSTNKASGDNGEMPKQTPMSRLGVGDNGLGFAHLGFRVPDASAITERARRLGYRVIKPVGEVEVRHYNVEGRSEFEQHNNAEVSDARGSTLYVQWEGGFEKTIAQIAFIEDPDGNWIEILPFELKR